MTPNPEQPSFHSLLQKFISELERFSLCTDSHPAHVTSSIEALQEHMSAIIQKTELRAQADDVHSPNVGLQTTDRVEGERAESVHLDFLSPLDTQQQSADWRANHVRPSNECVRSTSEPRNPHDSSSLEISAPLTDSTTIECEFSSSRCLDILPALESHVQKPGEYEARDGLEEMDSESIEDAVQQMIDFCQDGQDDQDEAMADSAEIGATVQPTFVQKMPHSVADGILTFHPNQEQWPCFPDILHSANHLGVEKAGSFKIHLSHLQCSEHAPLKSKPCSYGTQLRKNGIINITTTDDDFINLPPDQTLRQLSDYEAVERLEQKIAVSETLGESRYYTDIPVRTDEERANMGLPASPIWPIQSNKLSLTKYRVPGIHWPYAYEANACLGAIFAMHIEDFALYSLNVLYKARKIWVIIPPAEKEKLESILWNKRGSPECAQFVRENAAYIPTHILKQWNVRFQILRQDPGDIVVTLPGTYHQGFSVGATRAEAVNYAAEDWNPDQYNACTANKCPPGFIGRNLMTFIENGELQVSADEDSLSDSSLPSNSDTESNVVDDGLQDALNTTRQLREKIASKTRRRKAPAKQAKRKEPPVRHQKPAKKSHSVDRLYSDFNNVLVPPKTPVEEVYVELQRHSASAGLDFDDSRYCLLTKLFFAIGSPDAIYQLRGAYASAGIARSELLLTKNSVIDSIRALDTLDSSIHLYAILRRFHLVSLCHQRDALLAETRQTRYSNFRDTGTSETIAHKKLMTHAYPGLLPSSKKTSEGSDEYTQKSRALTRRLVIGQKWLTLGKAFTPGILALFPTQGDYRLSNSDYESLPTNAIGVLIDILKRHRGAFLQEISECLRLFTRPGIDYSFINQDIDKVKEQEYDSPRLVELCKLQADGDFVVPDPY